MTGASLHVDKRVVLISTFCTVSFEAWLVQRIAALDPASVSFEVHLQHGGQVNEETEDIVSSYAGRL
jgi:hypothetical protein